MTRLTSEQKQFLEAEGKVVLSACPGSGKTFIIARKLFTYIANWHYEHRGVAVISFTNVASLEISKQAKALMPDGYRLKYPHFIGTIDSFINNFIILRFGYLLNKNSRKRPVILQENHGQLQFFSRHQECHRRGCISNPLEFNWSISGELLRNGKPLDCPISVNRPCVTFKTAMIKKGFISQNEVSALSYILLKRYPQIGKIIARRFPVIMIDEAQDTSEEQMAIIDSIADAGIKTLIVVGDPDQCIYEWRNATPKYFIEKRNDNNWKSIWLTSNFRSSQLICNATREFAHSLISKKPSKAEGDFAGYPQKPILLRYSENTERNVLVNRFKELCKESGIDCVPSKVAVLTRAKIHKEVDISGLWKTPEIESLAKASYEWHFGSRKKAFNLCEKVLYSFTIGDIAGTSQELRPTIELIIPYDQWRKNVVHMLVSLPHPNLKLVEWVKEMVKSITTVIENSADIALRSSVNLHEQLKIKSRDTKNPNFRSIPLRNFIEKKDEDDITISSVHGVKGETFDAVMLIVEGTKGKTITPSLLENSPLDNELIRIAYVAMTRPRKLLVVALPKTKKLYSNLRLSSDKWNYIDI